jgi:hypothetical protein
MWIMVWQEVTSVKEEAVVSILKLEVDVWTRIIS